MLAFMLRCLSYLSVSWGLWTHRHSHFQCICAVLYMKDSDSLCLSFISGCLEVFMPLFCNDPLTLGRGVMIQISHIGLNILQSLILYVLASCGFLCYSPLAAYRSYTNIIGSFYGSEWVPTMAPYCGSPLSFSVCWPPGQEGKRQQ